MHDSRTRLLPWVSNGKAHARPRMKDAGWREPVRGNLRHPLPGQIGRLTATTERAVPELRDVVSEGQKRARVGRHGVVRKVPAYNRLQPLPLFGKGLMHALPQLLLDLSEFRSHAIAARLALELEGSSPRLAADERKPQEGEGLRFAV